jgi:integrase
MPRKATFPPPVYTRRGKDFTRVWTAGRARDVWLGPSGSAEARAAYARLVAELAAGREPAPAPPAPAAGLTVRAAAATFLAGQEGRRAEKELRHFGYALAVVTDLFPDLPAAAFGPRELRRVAEEMARRGWCRRHANRNLTRVKTCWRWLEGEGLLPAGSWHHLRAARGLGHGEARESGEVLPVPEGDLAATLPHLNPVVRAAVEVQLRTGARPSEVLGLRPCDLVREGRLPLGGGFTLPLGQGVWAALPARHKNVWRGHRRFLLLGPRAQAALAPFLGRPPDAFLFSPREAYEQALTALGRAVRRDRGRAPGDRYTPDSYRRAVWNACDRAFPPPPPLGRREGESWRAWHARLTDARRAELDAWRRAHRWHPYRLRHNAATRLSAEFGPEVARVVLGHRHLETTRGYTLDDLARAAEALRQVG